MTKLKYQLFDSATDTSPGTGPVKELQLRRGDIGLIQIQITGGTALVNIEGRLHSSMPWSELASFDETDMDAQKSDSLLQAIRLCHEVRCNVIEETGDPDIKVFLQE